jgi:DNA-binding response OmpR family regulator
MELLWVENHSQFVRSTLPFLAGHSVIVVPTVVAARAALAERHFDVVLVDFDLEDGKGTELIRDLNRPPGRPIIVATSSHADGNNALLHAGADAICGKLEFARIPGLLQSLAKPQGISAGD